MSLNHEQIAASLCHIRPGAEYLIRDVSIEWLDTKQTEPTQAEIETGWIAYQEAQTQAEADKAVAKAAAEAKLAALGLTADDLKALGLG